MSTYRFILLLFLLLLLPGLLSANEFAIVVNKNNPITSLDQASIKKIFLGKKTFWEDGHSIDVYLQKQKDLHKAFTKKVLNKSVRQYKMYWRRELYSGTGLPPQQVINDQALKSEIVSNTRAIGYIHVNNLDDTVKRIQVIEDTIAQN